MKNVLFSTLLCGCFAALPGLAQNSVGSPIRAEILPGWVQADGSRIVGLKFTLAPGWKTYWRSPGDAGIPPQFDWSGSDNLRGIGITWPTPQVFHQSGMRSLGYAGAVVLPLTVAPRRSGDPVTLNLSLDLGVCSDICMPEHISLSATLDTAVTSPTPEIAAALAARPYSAAEAGVSAASCALRPYADGLSIEVRLTMPPTGGDEVVVIEPGQPNIWMSETDSRRSGGQLVAAGTLAASDGGAIALDRSTIRITVLGQNRAVEITGCTPG